MTVNDNPSFNNKVWKTVSKEVIDFIKACLHKDPAKRPTSIQILDHPWLQDVDRKGKSSTTKGIASKFRLYASACLDNEK